MMDLLFRSRLKGASSILTIGLMLGAGLFAVNAYAQTPEDVSDLSRRVETLERHVSELENLLAAEGEELTKIKLELRLPEALGRPFTGLGPSASHAFSSRAPIRFGLLGEMRWMRPVEGAGLGVPGTTTQISRFLTFVSMRFSNQLAASAAFTVQESNLAKADPAGIRFAHVDYRWEQETGIRVGNLLVPIGIYNLRSDPFLFPTVRAPFVETVIIPSPWHENGLLFYVRKGRVVAQGGLLTGFQARGLEGATWLRGGRQGAVAHAESGAGAARVEWMDNESSLGASAYFGEGHQGDPRLGTARAFLWEAHGEFRQGRVRGRFIFAEGILEDAEKISDITNQTIGSRARGLGVQLSYDVLPRLSPLVRDLIGRPAPPDWKELPLFVSWEYVNPQSEVPPGGVADLRSRIDALTFGVNYRPHPQVIFKFDHAIEKNGLDEIARVYEIGAGFAF